MKFRSHNSFEFAEVQYFFRALVGTENRALALVSVYSPPIPELLALSHGTLWASRYQGSNAFRVINVKSVLSVVAMVPLNAVEGHFFVVEKLGLDVAFLGGGIVENNGANEGEDNNM
jgi:hypothetical protein